MGDDIVNGELVAAGARERTEADAVAQIAQAAATPWTLEPEDGQVYSVVVPIGGRQVTLDLERFLPAPRRTKATYTVQTVDSLVDLVNRQVADYRGLTLWVDDYRGLTRVDDNAAAPTVTAVFNDATQAAPAWRDHRAVLRLAYTEEWQHWTGLDGQFVTQQEFAEHIEDGLAEIRRPDAADVLEIAQSFHATTHSTFRSAIRLDNGAMAMQYDEDVTAAAGRDPDRQVEIPEIIELALAPFVGEEPSVLRARLRYRARGGTVLLGYKLDHPERVVRTALEQIRERLVTAFGHCVFLGAPAAEQG